MKGHALRRTLAFGALLTVVGLAIGGTAPVFGTERSTGHPSQQVVGGILTLIGWAVLAWGVHFVGRETG